MEAITLPVYNSEGKEIDNLKLDHGVFDGVVNKDVIYQAIKAYRANQRKGLAATKTRGEVSGGGKKPWKQKGTGRARVGSTRSPLWRHGGVIFGPHPRSFSYVLPQKIRDLALKSSLNAKVKENNIMVLDSLKLESVKTKEAAKIFSNLKVNGTRGKSGSVLLILNETGKNVKLAMRNIDFLRLNLAKDTNVYEVLSSRRVIVTRDALADLIKRLKK